MPLAVRLAPRALALGSLASSMLAPACDWDAFDPRLGATPPPADAGTGGSGPARCGGMELLGDDFDEVDISPAWVVTRTAGATVAQQDGALVLTPGPEPGGVALVSQRFYDLRGGHVSVTLADAPAAGAAHLAVIRDAEHRVEVRVQGGMLSAVKLVAGVPTELAAVAFDADAHRRWRLLVDDDTTRWQTSADGQLWNTVASSPTAALFDMRLVRLSLGAEAPAALVRFDDLNGGAPDPDARFCPIASLHDDFDDGDRQRSWDRASGSPGATAVELGGELVLALPAGTGADYAYVTATAFDLRGDGVSVRLPRPPEPAAGLRAELRLTDLSGDWVAIQLEGDTLSFRQQVDAVQTELETLVFSPIQNDWWRLREQDGVMRWETSPNGLTWLTHAQVAPDPVDPRGVDVRLGGAASAPLEEAGTVVFDDLNHTP